MSWIRVLFSFIGRLFRLGVREAEETKEDVGGANVGEKVKLYVSLTSKEWVGGEIHPNAYRVDLSKDKKIMNEFVDVDVGFVKLVDDRGLTAVEWSGSSLFPVKVSIPYTVVVKGLGREFKFDGSVENGSSLNIRVPVKGLEVRDGFNDHGYFYFSELLSIAVIFYPIETRCLTSRENIEMVDAYTERQVFAVEAMLHSVVRIDEDGEEVSTKSRLADGEVVVGGGRERIIRTSPSVKLVLSELREKFKDVKPTTELWNLGGQEHILVEPDFVAPTGVFIAVKINDVPVALFSTENDYRRAIVPVKVGEKYNVDVCFVVDSAIYPFALYEPKLMVMQLMRSTWGWVYERIYGGVVGNDRRDTTLPIGLTSFQIIPEKDKSYVVRISAKHVEREIWRLYGVCYYDGDARKVVLRDLRLVSSVGDFEEDVSDDVSLVAKVYGDTPDGSIVNIERDGKFYWLWSRVDFSSRDKVVEIDVGKKPSLVLIEARGVFDGRFLWSLAFFDDRVERVL